MLAPDWMKVGRTGACGVGLSKPLTNVIHHHILGIPGADMASVHRPGQHSKKLTSNLAHLW